MKILLLGKNGQVGWELQRSLAPLGELVSLDRQGTEGICGNLANLAGLRATVRGFRPDIVVNAAAYTAVDRAEDEPELANLINAQAPQLLADEVNSLGGLLVHYSTDYVFNGSGHQAWAEIDQPDPLNQYGKSKLEGERAIQDSGCRHLIFRTSWVYAARGQNFAKTMLRLAAEREQLKVIDDQIGAPTGADLIADITAHALRQAAVQKELSGIYHVVASGEVSWCGYAQYVVEQARSYGSELAVRRIDPIPTSAYPTPAARPKNSRLDTSKIREHFSLHLPAWQEGVSRLLKEI